MSWIIEIYLNQLEDLTEQKNYDAFFVLHKEFQKFLDNNKIKVSFNSSVNIFNILPAN